MDDNLTDEAMLAAIRRRLMDEISRRSGSEQIVNNVYGGSPFGLTERLGQEAQEGSPGLSGLADDGTDPYEYMVDIDREDKLDPEGNKIGWNKRVRRYRTKTGMPGESEEKKK